MPFEEIWTIKFMQNYSDSIMIQSKLKEYKKEIL